MYREEEQKFQSLQCIYILHRTTVDQKDPTNKQANKTQNPKPKQVTKTNNPNQQIKKLNKSLLYCRINFLTHQRLLTELHGYECQCPARYRTKAKDMKAVGPLCSRRVILWLCNHSLCFLSLLCVENLCSYDFYLHTPLRTSPKFSDTTSKLAELDPLVSLQSFSTATESCFPCNSFEAQSLSVQYHVAISFRLIQYVFKCGLCIRCVFIAFCKSNAYFSMTCIILKLPVSSSGYLSELHKLANKYLSPFLYLQTLKKN